eukprot:1123819-Amphidinium_carterae.1
MSLSCCAGGIRNNGLALCGNPDCGWIVYLWYPNLWKVKFGRLRHLSHIRGWNFRLSQLWLELPLSLQQ